MIAGVMLPVSASVVAVIVWCRDSTRWSLMVLLRLFVFERGAYEAAEENADAQRDEQACHVVQVERVRCEHREQQDEDDEVLAILRCCGGAAGDDGVRAGLNPAHEERGARPSRPQGER